MTRCGWFLEYHPTQRCRKTLAALVIERNLSHAKPGFRVEDDRHKQNKKKTIVQSTLTCVPDREGGERDGRVGLPNNGMHNTKSKQWRWAGMHVGVW